MELSKLYRVLVLGGAMVAAPACGGPASSGNVQVPGGGASASTGGTNDDGQGATNEATDGGTSSTGSGGQNGGGSPTPW